MYTWQKILVAIGIVTVLFVAVDFDFFWKNFQYLTGSLPHSAPAAVQITSHGTTTKPSILEIPGLNIFAPIVYIDQLGEPAFQAALKNGVVHYPKTAKPGTFGNCYIFGHSSDYVWSDGKFKNVFALLPKIKKGDEILVSDEQGVQYTYVVFDTKIVGNNEIKYVDQGDMTKKILTVQTSYPVGTALRRFLAIAELTSP